MTKRKRARLIEDAMKLTWDSLSSHLEWTYGSKKEIKRVVKNNGGSPSFHVKAIKEYSRIIQILSKLY